MRKDKKNILIFALIIAIVILVNTCINNESTINSYKTERDNDSIMYNQHRSNILYKYASSVFPKYTYSGGAELSNVDEPMQYFTFQSILDPADTISFKVPRQRNVFVTQDETDRDGFDFSCLGVSMGDIKPQENMPALEDEKSYVLTASVRRLYDDEGNSISPIDAENYATLDDFRRDVYYDADAVNSAGPGGPGDDRFNPEYLYIWYGLASEGSEDTDIIFGIDEQTATRSISAAQLAADYLRILDENQIDFQPVKSLLMAGCADDIQNLGGRVKCLLLNGDGYQIKELIAGAEKEGYAITPLRVLGSK